MYKYDQLKDEKNKNLLLSLFHKADHEKEQENGPGKSKHACILIASEIVWVGGGVCALSNYGLVV